MFCSKCGNEILEGQNFCTKCGTKITDQENSNADFTIGKRQKENFLRNVVIAIISCGITYLAFFLLFLFSSGSSVPIFLTIMILGIGILFCLGSIGAEVILGKCPYCNSDISVPGNAMATDCPICQKRIKIKDDKFYKV